MLLRDIPLSEASVDNVAGAWLSRSAWDCPWMNPSRPESYIKLRAIRCPPSLRQVAPAQ